MRAVYVVTCAHCGHEVVAAHRLADPEFALLTDHLRESHPDVPTALGTAAILGHFAICTATDSAN
jgi:hypothetical protein